MTNHTNLRCDDEKFDISLYSNIIVNILCSQLIWFLEIIYITAMYIANSYSETTYYWCVLTSYIFAISMVYTSFNTEFHSILGNHFVWSVLFFELWFLQHYGNNNWFYAQGSIQLEQKKKPDEIKESWNIDSLEMEQNAVLMICLPLQ